MESPKDAKLSGFREIQYRFTSHIRDPEGNPAPADVEDRRMQIYRELIYNNVEDFLANTFPVLRKICEDGYWHELIRDYFKKHQARTPLFPKMSQEFLQYLDTERGDHEADFPFMKELAHYEWLELAISIDSREPDVESLDEKTHLLDSVPVLSPLAWPFSYVWPVHRISPEFLPEEAPAQPTFLVVYRDNKDEVGFLELNPVSARLIEVLQHKNSMTGREILQGIAQEIQHPDPEVVVQGGTEILNSMLTKNIILGSQKKS